MVLRTISIFALLFTLTGSASAFDLSALVNKIKAALPSLPTPGPFTGTGATASSLNEFRKQNGLKPLNSDGRLTSLASVHAADMARRNSLDHNGFLLYRAPAGARAENVAYGCKDTTCTIRLWINSSGHRANMLRPGLKRYGLASATAADGRRYWALELGE